MSMANITPDDPDYAKERSGVDKEALHAEMLDRHQACKDYWDPKYALARADVRFAFMPDDQWDEWMRDRRKGRPMYTVNKLRQAMKQITNDQRQNRPQAKVRAVEDADQDLAEIRQGLIRNIDSTSDADRARDTAFQFAVGGGYGVWRITTAYEDDGGFDQVIKKEEIADPYSTYCDPSAKTKDRRDARFWFEDVQMARGEFKERWPDAELVSVNNSLDQRGWWLEKDVVVSRYWYKKTEEVEICLLSTGETLDADQLDLIIDELAEAGVTIQRRRVAERTKVYHCIVSGTEIVEGPTLWPGRFIPLVPVWGEIINMDGEDHFFGAVRFAKDAQRMYNYERSVMIEIIDDQGYSPWLLTDAAAQANPGQWKSLRTRRPPALTYTPDRELPNAGRPERLPTPDFPVALANSSAMSSDDIKAATGIYDASLGSRSNETSGRAILARQREGDVANFDYIDNLAFAIKYDFEITNDLISAVYDTQRQIRIIGDDGAEKIIQANRVVLDRQTGREVVMNDLSRGRFDIAATVGPSFTTQRVEAAEAFQQLSQTQGPFGAIAAYNFMKNLDLPQSEEALKAMRRILVAQGLLEPEEGDQPPQQGPDPKQLAEMQKAQAAAVKSQADAQKSQADAQKAIADSQRSLAQGGLYAAQADSQVMDNETKQLAMNIASAMIQPLVYVPQNALPAPGGFPG